MGNEMPGSLLRHSRIEYAAIAGYVVLVVVVAVRTGAKAKVAIFGNAAGQAAHSSAGDLAATIAQVLNASTDFIAGACLLLTAALILYWRRRKATSGAAGTPTFSRSGPPFLL